jgi:hypothetical protein
MQPLRQQRTLGRRAAAIAGAGVLMAGLTAGAMTPAYADEPTEAPGLNEVAHTSNVELLASLGKPAGLGATNSDLAFTGDYAIAGNYNGFAIWDISEPAEPELTSTVVCAGGQGDISVYDDLLFFSVDAPRTNNSCASGATSSSNPTLWEGIRVFDISDKSNPQYVKSVQIPCGSHTNSMVQSKDLKSVYVYSSSYALGNANYANCALPHDNIAVVKVPLDAPEQAALVGMPTTFPDGGSTGGTHPNGTPLYATDGCHDITTFGSRDVMAAACMGDGAIYDITDRENPVLIDTVRDENFFFWHSATWNNAGNKVVFTDELGGGGLATCDLRPQNSPKWGANGIYDLEDDELVFKSYYKMPRTQHTSEICVAHNGSLIPVKGKDIMVQAWYAGGWSVFDFTDSENPVEIAWFDRGPRVTTPNPVSGGNWSTYWYNGHIYSNEIARGFDVAKITDARLGDANDVELDSFNPQMQQLMLEAVDFDSLRELIEDADITASVRASLLNRLDRTEAQAAKGSELGAYTSLAQLIDRAKNQIKGGMSTTDRDAIVAAAQAFHDDIKAADYYEK